MFGRRVPAPVLLIGDETLSLRPTGRVPDRWQAFSGAESRKGLARLVDDNVRRQRLVESFEARNAASHELPAVDRADFIRVENQRLDEVRRQYSDRPVGVSRLSLPGYSSDGYAMVVASYGCGSLCRSSWLIILDNTTVTWRLTKTQPLSIS
jgi:hypothetical protein